MDDLHQVHLERYQDILDDRRSALDQQVSAAEQALDWAVIETAATQRLARWQVASLENHGLIGEGYRNVDARRAGLADLRRRLVALDALVDAVDDIARERRNRPKES